MDLFWDLSSGPKTFVTTCLICALLTLSLLLLSLSGFWPWTDPCLPRQWSSWHGRMKGFLRPVVVTWSKAIEKMTRRWNRQDIMVTGWRQGEEKSQVFSQVLAIGLLDGQHMQERTSPKRKLGRKLGYTCTSHMHHHLLRYYTNSWRLFWAIWSGVSVQ